MGLIDDIFSRYQDTSAAVIGINPMGSSTETITTSKKIAHTTDVVETVGGFQKAVGEGIGGGFEAWGEGAGYGYGQIATGVGSNIIPLGLLAIGGLILAKKF